MKIATMVPLVSFLAALRILTEAQICNNGEGKIVYEKIISRPDSQFDVSNASSYEIITRNNPPLKVLEECFRRCQEDRLSKISSCVRFDFLPGKRNLIAYTSNIDTSGKTVENSSKVQHDKSVCVLYSDSNTSVNLNELAPNHGSAWHFNEVCLSAQSINRNCPNRPYVFERIPGFWLSVQDNNPLTVIDRNECENRCLTERSFTCRSASFNTKTNQCYLSNSNRHILPTGLQQNTEFEYLENMCIKHNEVCKWNVLVTETGKQLDSAYEKLWTASDSVNNCSNMCLDSLDKYGFVCRSFVFDENNQSCILYDEDPTEIASHGNLTSPALVASSGNLYRVLCSTDDKDQDLDNKTLECYRRKRLRGRHQMELSTANFYECLSNCFKQYGKTCRSIEYSYSQKVCRFSGHSVAGPVSQLDKDVLIDDDSFDYYQFMWNQEDSSKARFAYDQTNFTNDQIPSTDRLTDRHDSIEVSHSQPGVYGNFILPTEQTRDHHRAGFAYNKPEYPQKSPITTSQAPKPPSQYKSSQHTDRQPSYRQPQRPTLSANNNYNYLNTISRTTQVSDTMPRTPSISINSNPMPRTPMISNSMPLNNRFISYGIPPYAPYTQGTSPQSYPHNPSMSLVSNSVPYPTQTSGSHDRFGHIHPSKNENSVQSTGCKYDASSQSDSSKFRRVGFSARLKSKHIYKVVRAERLEDCEKYCIETKDFVCKSFNFRAFFPDNCELSNLDTKKHKLEDLDHFEHNTQFDYYERVERKALLVSSSMDCFEVLQSCSPEGMELKLKTTEGFYGRIYTYGFYDSCFFDGNGGTTSVLRISKPNGFPRCGTQQMGDAMTNIVVVQFNDYVQTSRDKKYNLTCFISGPGEAVVTSNYLDTKTDGRHPMQIEHLPAQNILTSNIVLRVLYRGTPTNTIVVGDLLTFRLEARNQYRLNGYHNDIFASNVIAKDPYTGRQVLLIDSRGCPVDLFVFPELHKTPDGALEAEFYAFKIPDSNFLVFQATVKTCKGPCEPVICTDRGRGQGSFPSWGRRKRAIRNTLSKFAKKNRTKGEEEEVHEMFRVYLSHDDMPESSSIERPQVSVPSSKMCVDKFAYYTMVLFTALFVIFFVILLPYFGLIRMMKFKYKGKNSQLNPWEIKWPGQVPTYTVQRTFDYSPHFGIPRVRQSIPNSTEPIYSDVSIMERSRSLQSLTVQDGNKVIS